MTSEIIKQFNEILSSFLIQLGPRIGSCYNAKFEQIIKYNSILPIEQFLVYALPLRDKIKNRDETYFIDNDNHKEHIADDVNTLNEILRLQNIYSELNEESKKNVWDILQAMLILGEEYIIIKNKNI